MTDMNIVSFGNTGCVGRGFVAAALEDPRTSRLFLVNRREVAPSADPRVVHLTMTDFARGYDAAFSDVADRIDLVHWSLGGPPSFEQLRDGAKLYHQLHVAFPSHAAEYFAARNPDVVFHYASGAMVGEGKWPIFLHKKALAERLISERVRSISYRPRVVVPAGKQKRLPDFMAIESKRYGQFTIEAHGQLVTGAIQPGATFEHREMVASTAK
jgi:hypothetical protein